MLNDEVSVRREMSSTPDPSAFDDEHDTKVVDWNTTEQPAPTLPDRIDPEAEEENAVNEHDVTERDAVLAMLMKDDDDDDTATDEKSSIERDREVPAETKNDPLSATVTA
ncbi:hypothetical protein BLNAU_13847 [Blattamonas nauphoetae]|uniref:Uncharacterized protein n=1 Tax=Blattamonas nauphoetae TaxID=2049346 RepID=A0ABQ9XFI7_9EUKA|nr:hypothetical protein BLNAU_13847 [Blattamonas nauphoetae]